MTERTAPPDETKKGARHYALREGRLVMTTTSGIHCLARQTFIPLFWFPEFLI
jgi:hypothetical protein